MYRQFFHSGLVGQNAAASFWRTGIDRQDGNPVTRSGQHASEAFNKSAFARARQSRDAYAQRLARVWHQGIQDFSGGFLIGL